MILNSRTKMFLFVAGMTALVGCKPTPEKAPDSVATVPETAVTEVKPVPVEAPAAQNDAAVINFRGFGPARFGDNEESVRMSWGRPLNAGKPVEGSTCFYLNPETMPEAKRGIAFMFEEGKFVRYDVDDATQIAPGNFKVGDAGADVKTAFASRVEEAPHKYIEGGRTLTVTPEDKSAARLIFEIGKDGKISNWRIGVPPQIFYVEGCG